MATVNSKGRVRARKAISVFFALIFLLSLTSQSLAATSSTERREAFEFYGLYVKRFIDICKTLGFELDPLAGTTSNMIFPNKIADGNETFMMASTHAGFIVFSVTDHAIQEISATYYDKNVSDEKNDGYTVNILAVISALEYSAYDEYYSNMQNKLLGINNKSAADRVIDLYLDDLAPAAKKASLSYPKEDTLVYSGNYNYYISYNKRSSGEGYFTLTAKAR